MRAFFYALCILAVMRPATGLAFEQGAARGPMYVYRSSESFDLIKENLHMAITNRGLLISGTLHVSEMLERTAADLGITTPVYAQAESVEFCSAVISHKMIQADPLNLAVCPFTVSLFTKTAEPEVVYVAFRKIFLAGDEALNREVEEFLHGLVREALELE